MPKLDQVMCPSPLFVHSQMYIQYCINLNKTVLLFFPCCPRSSQGGTIESYEPLKNPQWQATMANRTHQEDSERYVVQVTIKQAQCVVHYHYDTSYFQVSFIFPSKDVIKELSTFFIAQYDITVRSVSISISYPNIRFDVLLNPSNKLSYLHPISSPQKAIESVLYAHILITLPQEIKIAGKGYVLKGSKCIHHFIFLDLTSIFLINLGRKPWSYGRTLAPRLRWDDESQSDDPASGCATIRPCQDKWMFIFETVPEV